MARDRPGGPLATGRRTFITYYGLEFSILGRPSKRERLDKVRRRIDMFLRTVAEQRAKVGARGPRAPRDRS